MGLLKAFLALILMVGGACAYNISSDLYSVGSTHQGLSGGNMSSSDYSARFTTTYQQPGNPNASGGGISANIGWFSAPTTFCGILSDAGFTYTLTSNVSVNGVSCFQITAANITLDCAGYTITGSNATDTYGIYSSAANTTIKNCRIQNFSVGILYNNSAGGQMTNNTINLTYATGQALRFDGTAENNSATLNNLTAAIWVNNSALGNTFNTSLSACYQESTNVSACGDQTAGTYFWNGTGSESDIYMNYSKPTGVNSSIWQFKHGNLTTYNSTLPASCFAQTPIQIRAISKNEGGDYKSYAECWNGTGFMNFTQFSGDPNGDACACHGLPFDCGTACSSFTTSYNNIDRFVDADWATGVSMSLSPATPFQNEISDPEIGNFFSSLYEEAMWWEQNESVGNIYYFVNGTPSWNVFHIFNSSTSNWASLGVDRPFNATTVFGNWTGNGEDWYPFTLNNSHGPFIFQNVTFINASSGHSFIANATARDFAGSAEIVSWSFSTSLGTCTNTTSSNLTDFRVGLNCTSTNPGTAQINITFTDSDGNTTFANGSNAYPDLAPSLYLVVDPDPAYANSTLTCNVTFTDPDGDTENVSARTYQWHKNFAPIVNRTSSTLSPSNFSIGDLISCEVNATNSTWPTSNATNYSANRTIDSHPPVVVQNVTFTNATVGHSFISNATFMDPEGTGDIASWKINTTFGTCVNLSNYFTGENLTLLFNCTSDNPGTANVSIFLYDLSGMSANTSGLNSYPDPNNVSLSRPSISGAIYNASNATCTPGNFTDPDGDLENTSSRTWMWFKNGVFFGTTTQTINLTTANWSIGDNISCRENTSALNWTTSSATNISLNTTISTLPAFSVSIARNYSSVNFTCFQPTMNNTPPNGQDWQTPILNVTSTYNLTIYNVTMSLNQSLPAGFSIWCQPVNYRNPSSINVTTSAQNILARLLVNQSKGIWCVGQCLNVSDNQNISVNMTFGGGTP